MSKNTRTLNATTVPALPSAPNKIDPELKKFLDKSGKDYGLSAARCQNQYWLGNLSAKPAFNFINGFLLVRP